MATLGELAQHLGAELIGDPDCVIERVATLTKAQAGDIAFLGKPAFRKHLATCQASAVIVTEADRDNVPGNALITEDPYLAYALVARYLYPLEREPGGRHSSAQIDPSADIHPDAWIGPACVIEAGAQIGAGTSIGPGCLVRRHVRIGANSRLMARVTVCEGCEIGDNVLIHPGAVIGSDGFGLANDRGQWVKIPQLGRVRIGNDVEIGANTTIDRGAIEDTIIEDGVKIDNLVQIAHNVHIGAHTAIAGCVGIAGSTIIGRYCALGGGVGVVGHVEIADHVHITGMSMVTHNITQAGVYSSGTPLQANAQWRRNAVRFKELDDMARRLKELENNHGGNTNG